MRTAESQRAARELLHVTMLVMRRVAADMRRAQLPLAPAQLGTLMRVSAGACTLSDLARHQAVSLPTMSRSVDMLVRRRLLERWVDPDDRRQTLVQLTPEGASVVADVRRRSERHVGRILEDLSVDECDRVVDALDVLERILKGPDDVKCRTPVRLKPDTTPAVRVKPHTTSRSNGARRHVPS